MVSIIISAVHLGEFFEECITSCISQTYRDIEILLVTERGSADEALCQRAAERDGRIHVLLVEPDTDIGTCRNAGIKAAQGEYLSFVDADDMFYDDTSVERMLRALTVESGDVLVCNYIRRLGDEMIPVVPHGFTEREQIDGVDFRFRAFVSIGHLSYVWGKLYRREFLEEHGIVFPPSSHGEDKAFNMCVYGARPDFVFSDQVIYVYRMNASSITMKYKADYKENNEKNMIFFDRYMEGSGAKKTYPDLSAFAIMFSMIFHIRQEYDFGMKIKDFSKVVEQYTTDDYVRQKMQFLVDNKVCGQIEHTPYRTGTDNLSKWMLRQRNDAIAFWLEKMFAIDLDKKHSDTRGRAVYEQMRMPVVAQEVKQ